MKTYLTLTALVACSLGCEVPELDVPERTAVPVVEEQPVEEKVKEGYLADGRIDMSGVAGEPPMTTSTPREVTAKDPKKGKLSRRVGGYLGSTVDKIPWAENKIKFMMIKSNMEIYNAIKGDYPKSHEEFMEVYLPEYYPAALPLPELEPGDEYIYDPEDHLLKIYRPGADADTESDAETGDP